MHAGVFIMKFSLLSFIVVLLFSGVLFYVTMRRKLFRSFTIQDIVVVAFFCSLLYVAVLPFRFGLSRLPFIHALIFSIPFTAVLFVGIRVVPKMGSATLIIFGHSLLSQVLSRGINPLWWPYALISAFSLELYFIATGSYLGTRKNAFFAGLLRGAVVYSYFYLFSAPYIWHLHYEPWYIVLQTIQGVAGSAAGGLIGYSLSKPILRAYRHGGV